MVRELLEQGKGVKEIARILDLTPATVSYHKTKLGYPPNRRCARRYDWEAIQAYYDEGHTRTACQERFGFSASSWCDAVLGGDIVPRPVPMPVGELLAANQPRARKNIKRRLLRLLCPNCHSQTPNFGSKNWRRRPG